MKATGIVRRIDDLGRVVIPKEIRRTMKIREGDPLEIFTTSGGEVIFKKYSMVGEVKEAAVSCAAALGKMTKLSVLICDRDTCIAAANISKREVIDRTVTKELEYIMEGRNTVRDRQNANALHDYRSPIAAASPIVTGGDVAGCVVLLSNETAEKAGDTDIKLLDLSSEILADEL
ncbi:MAG: AbrB/MazE/SpoVT family DNA-binding domain-containing protein [Clostridia bacterium]|nr:AbrB/MazE/SpoVT family DNA-binding domain-containing protein [Clostridia bacterium]